MIRKILYINSPTNDFLSDSFLIGLKELFKDKVLELPVNKFIYSNVSDNNMLHGIGFTVSNVFAISEAKVLPNDFDLKEIDLFIFGDIYRQREVYLKLYSYLSYSNTIILDGEDTSALFPYYFAPWKRPYSLLFPKPHKKFIYFKRELIPCRTNYYRFYKLLPKVVTHKLPLPKNVFPISFSIPDLKIIKSKPIKLKRFVKHIVDEELVINVLGSSSKYVFDKEADYYADIQASEFGITTKRGGWDCLRHYEIAANGAVICFKNLHQKPALCAPHGLIDGVNCISYTSYTELMSKIENINNMQYALLQQNSLSWVKKQASSKRAQEIINAFIKKQSTE